MEQSLYISTGSKAHGHLANSRIGPRHPEVRADRAEKVASGGVYAYMCFQGYTTLKEKISREVSILLKFQREFF
jgi:hypothetical protein